MYYIYCNLQTFLNKKLGDEMKIPKQKPIEKILERFPNATMTPKGWYVTGCPACGEENLLSFKENGKQNVQLKCRKGCIPNKILEEIGLNFDTFDAVIVGEDVEHKKPSPDIFLLAAERMGLAPTECLVIEDALNGVQAAKAAGAGCLAITTSFTAEQLYEADWFAPDLAHAPADAIKWQNFPVKE